MPSVLLRAFSNLLEITWLAQRPTECEGDPVSLSPGWKSNSSSLLFLANAASFSEISHADNG